MIITREKPPVHTGGFFITTSKGIRFLVDLDDYLHLSKYHWRAKKKKKNWYAYRRTLKNGRMIEIALHRTIAKTPPGLEPHHKNHNTLDNRKNNLENVPHNAHPHH